MNKRLLSLVGAALIATSCDRQGYNSPNVSNVVDNQSTQTTEQVYKTLRELLLDSKADRIDESDMSLRNLFDALKTMARSGQCVDGEWGNTKNVLYGVSSDGREYFMESQRGPRGGHIRVNIGNAKFGISYDMYLADLYSGPGRKNRHDGLEHYGDEIPSDILTQLLDGKTTNPWAPGGSFNKRK